MCCTCVSDQNSTVFLLIVLVGHHAPSKGAFRTTKSGMVATQGTTLFYGWEFHYDGCEEIVNKNYRDGVTTPEVPIPESHKGCLDSEKLEKLGLAKERMRNEDSLFGTSFSFLSMIRSELGLRDP